MTPCQPTLSNQTVQVLVVGPLDAQVPSADVVDGLVVDHEAAVRVLEGGVGRQDTVVRLDHGRCHLWGRVDAELKLALLAVVDRETLHQQSPETGSRTTAEGVEDEEPLEARAVVRHTSHLVQDAIDQFLADGVVTASVVVGRILLAGDHLLGVEETPIRASPHFIDDVGLEITVDGTRHVLSLAYHPSDALVWGVYA